MTTSCTQWGIYLFWRLWKCKSGISNFSGPRMMTGYQLIRQIYKAILSKGPVTRFRFRQCRPTSGNLLKCWHTPNFLCIFFQLQAYTQCIHKNSRTYVERQPNLCIAHASVMPKNDAQASSLYTGMLLPLNLIFFVSTNSQPLCGTCWFLSA